MEFETLTFLVYTGLLHCDIKGVNTARRSDEGTCDSSFFGNDIWVCNHPVLWAAASIRGEKF
jgi:hypothetical protein